MRLRTGTGGARSAAGRRGPESGVQSSGSSPALASTPSGTGRANSLRAGVGSQPARPTTAGSHIRPWHHPIPARVRSFTVRTSPAPRSATASRIGPAVTSSQRHTTVSSVTWSVQCAGGAYTVSSAPEKARRRVRERIARVVARGSGAVPESRAAIDQPAMCPSARARAEPPTPVVSPRPRHRARRCAARRRRPPAVRRYGSRAPRRDRCAGSCRGRRRGCRRGCAARYRP